MSVEENNVLARLIHTFIIEYIKTNDYLSLKIFLYLVQKKCLQNQKRYALITLDKEKMAEACGISSRVLINHLKKMKSLTLVSQDKNNNRIDHLTLFASLSIYVDEGRIELYLLSEHRHMLSNILNRYLHLDFSSLFLPQSVDTIKMVELLERMEERRVFELYELNYLFNKDYKSSRELLKRFLIPLSIELQEESKYTFSHELLKEGDEKEKALPILIVKERPTSHRERKNKKLEAFLVWIENYKEKQRLDEMEAQKKELLDENAKWQERVTFKMDKLAHYLGF